MSTHKKILSESELKAMDVIFDFLKPENLDNVVSNFPLELYAYYKESMHEKRVTASDVIKQIFGQQLLQWIQRKNYKPVNMSAVQFINEANKQFKNPKMIKMLNRYYAANRYIQILDMEYLKSNEYEELVYT